MDGYCDRRGHLVDAPARKAVATWRGTAGCAVLHHVMGDNIRNLVGHAGYDPVSDGLRMVGESRARRAALSFAAMVESGSHRADLCRARRPLIRYWILLRRLLAA